MLPHHCYNLWFMCMSFAQTIGMKKPAMKYVIRFWSPHLHVRIVPRSAKWTSLQTHPGLTTDPRPLTQPRAAARRTRVTSLTSRNVAVSVLSLISCRNCIYCVFCYAQLILTAIKNWDKVKYLLLMMVLKIICLSLQQCYLICIVLKCVSKTSCSFKLFVVVFSGQMKN